MHSTASVRRTRRMKYDTNQPTQSGGWLVGWCVMDAGGGGISLPPRLLFPLVCPPLFFSRAHDFPSLPLPLWRTRDAPSCVSELMRSRRRTWQELKEPSSLSSSSIDMIWAGEETRKQRKRCVTRGQGQGGRVGKGAKRWIHDWSHQRATMGTNTSSHNSSGVDCLLTDLIHIRQNQPCNGSRSQRGRGKKTNSPVAKTVRAKRSSKTSTG